MCFRPEIAACPTLRKSQNQTEGFAPSASQGHMEADLFHLSEISSQTGRPVQPVWERVRGQTGAWLGRGGASRGWGVAGAGPDWPGGFLRLVHPILK